MRISDWSSDVCSSDLLGQGGNVRALGGGIGLAGCARKPTGELRRCEKATAYQLRGATGGRCRGISSRDARENAAIPPNSAGRIRGIGGFLRLLGALCYLGKKIGRASCRDRVCSTFRSRWARLT